MLATLSPMWILTFNLERLPPFQCWDHRSCIRCVGPAATCSRAVTRLHSPACDPRQMGCPHHCFHRTAALPTGGGPALSSEPPHNGTSARTPLRGLVPPAQPHRALWAGGACTGVGSVCSLLLLRSAQVHGDPGQRLRRAHQKMFC